MDQAGVTRRAFLKNTAAATGAAVVMGGRPVWGDVAGGAKRSAVDQVELGKTGIRLSRLGIGTGANNGHVQRELGKEKFAELIRYAFERGITYVDCAQNYVTFEWVGDAIKGLPREKVFLLSKVPGRPGDVLATIDRHRSVYKTDYIDCLLIHCMTDANWTEDWKRVMEGFNTAKEKGWVKARGVSCHSLPALQDANRSDWTEVHLVRVNPQGRFMDGEADRWDRGRVPVDPVLKEIEAMHAKGRGVIGMKIMGNGTFLKPEEREASVRFAMSNPNIDAVTIGMKSREEVDENIAMIDRALLG